MKIPTLPFTVTDWSGVEATEHPGETGKAYWRTLNIGDVRVRMVEYTPGYLADHWCDRGHILYVLEGELDTELLPVHMVLIRDMGMTLGEILDLDELAADCEADGVWEFLLTAPPIKFSAAVGSPINPLAIK